jgi:hypothetical protein
MEGAAQTRPLGDLPADLRAVLESAARLQELVSDAVLVSESADALYAAHRASFVHDHAVADLRQRFDVVLDAIEREGDWVTNRVRAGKVILGRLGDIETGIRQLIRTVPLETQRITLSSRRTLVVPTAPETLRIKAFLIVARNQTRDYLDVAALADRYGIAPAAWTLAHLDEYYADMRVAGTPVGDQVVRQLADPQPADLEVTRQLSVYKQLVPRWTRWRAVTDVCGELASAIVEEEWV